MSRATIQAIDRDQALRFWQGQRDGRIFLHPDVLESMCPQVDWWLGSWNTWPACLWPVCHGADGIHAPPELAAAFATRSLGVGLIVWAALGALAGHFRSGKTL